ncbi:MAG: regulatory protein RecX [Brachybacterium sp.]|nr:regulatory protein RecX [Brachybacterium sp.]
MPDRPTADLDAVRATLARRTEEILSSGAGRGRPSEQDQAFEKAVVSQCRYLMRLLASRRRSAGEMRSRLREREAPGAVIHEALARLDRAGLIDDAAFAAEWVRQRRDLRGLADEALRRELADREVDADVIAEALGAAETGEEQRARELVRNRLRGDLDDLAADVDGSVRGKVARRLDALLRRRGYDGALALQVISTELRSATGR